MQVLDSRGPATLEFLQLWWSCDIGNEGTTVADLCQRMCGNSQGTATNGVSETVEVSQ